MMDSVQFQDVATRGFSKSIFGMFNILNLIENPAKGIRIFDDFVGFNGSATGQFGGANLDGNTAFFGGAHGAWASYQDTGDTILQRSEVGGVVRLSVASTNNNESWLSTGAGGAAFDISTSAPKAIGFEARVRFGQIAAQNFFLGLAQASSQAENFIADSGGTLADKSLIGFHVLEGGPTALRFTWRKSGQAVQLHATTLKTLVANTWYKLGFLYDPSEKADRRIKVFVDGQETGVNVTATNLAAATFPNGNLLTPIMGGKNNNAANTFDIDWIHVVQEC